MNCKNYKQLKPTEISVFRGKSFSGFCISFVHAPARVTGDLNKPSQQLRSHKNNRPYALTSRLHNNDAMLGVKTCRAACTCCAGRALALSASQWVRGPGGMACKGWPAGCMLGDAMAHVTVPRLTPNTRGRPSVMSYAYGLYIFCGLSPGMFLFILCVSLMSSVKSQGSLFTERFQ